MPSRRNPVSEFLTHVHTYLHYRDVEKDAAARKGDKKKGPYHYLVEYLKAHGEEDENTGSLSVTFEDPLTIGGVTYTGLQWRCDQGSQYIDEEAAQELARLREVVDRVTHTEVVWDYDEFYVLYQQGLIEEDELDSIIVQGEPKWSLQVIK